MQSTGVPQSASPEWRVIAERIIRPLMAQSSIRVLCHPVTQSILLQLDPTVLEHDVYCICGRCGTVLKQPPGEQVSIGVLVTVEASGL